MPGERRARTGGALRRATALVALLAAGCESPTLPGEAPAFDPTALSDGRLVRWPLGRTVRVYVVEEDAMAGGGSVAAAARRAVAAWEGATRYGELSLRLSTSLVEADVVVRHGAAAAVVDEGICGGGVADGAGFTHLCIDGDSARTLPIVGGGAPGRVKVAVVVRPGAGDVGGALDALVAHELGHALGIAGHSADPADLMHPSPTVARPSERDARTLRYLLHQPADVRL